MQGGHSRANILMKSLCQLSRSQHKPLNTMMFSWLADGAAATPGGGPNLALQQWLRVLQRG
jgi:hypothetical protein